MKQRRTLVAITAGALSLALAACGGGGTSDDGSDGGGETESTFNAAVDKVYAPSDAKGGTIRYAVSENWDSLDGADTYYALSWNFIRNYGRSLTMFTSKPGAEGAVVVPDMAESLGKPSKDLKTWTYTLKDGIKFEDGTPVTSKDVKYAVERSLDKTTFPNGPTYYNNWLDIGDYTSPYKDKDPNKLGLKAVETPDDKTIVFHLVKPFSTFDYFAMLPGTIPVPIAKDTGSKYKEKIVSTGPYKFETNNINKNFTLVRNDQWDPATDTERKALPDRIEVELNVNANDIDNRLISGDLEVDIAGTGVQAAAQGRILADPALKAHADVVPDARLWFTSVNPDVAPLDDVHCRRAVQYAADKVGYQNAYGGPLQNKIATHLLPPLIPQGESFDPYPSPDGKGDVTKAKDELAQCGQPNGFSTNMSFRGDRPKEKAMAESLQQSLAKAGIKLTLKPYPTGDYFKLYAGSPAFAKKNGLGLMAHGWGADWSDGFGFLNQIVDSRVIHEAGNTNLSVKSDKVDAAIDKALLETDTDARNKLWTDVDKAVMEDASILPGVWAAGLLYRPDDVVNVYNSAYGMYDYIGIGIKQ